MNKPRQRRISIVLTVLILSTWLVSAPALLAAATPLPFRISGQVTAINGPADFSGTSVQRTTANQDVVDFSFVRYYVVRATGTSDSYSFDLEATGSAPVVATQLGFDPETRRQLIAVGTPTDASFAKLREVFLNSDASSSASASTATMAASVEALALKRGHVFYGTFWTDPLGITVNDVVDEAKFYSDGTKVSSLLGYDGRTWLSGNGWWEVSHSISAFYNSNRTLGTVATYDNFRTSSWFPLPICGTTNVYYSTNKVYAKPNRLPSGATNTWQTGTCGFLLSYTAMAFQGT